MIFNLKIKAETEVKRYAKNCLEILFCRSNTEFDRVIKSRKIKLNYVQQQKFKKEEYSEIKIWQLSLPELVIIKKVENNEKLNNDFFRNYFAGLIQSIEKEKFRNVFIRLPEYRNYSKFFKTIEYFYQSMVEGLLLGNYSFKIYKSDNKSPSRLNVALIHKDKTRVDGAIKNGEALINGVYIARDLVNEPANILTPQEYSRRIKAQLKDPNVTVKIFNERELAKRKMNAILSVGRASSNKPRMIIAHYKPLKKSQNKIALVGKGVTYDTGGLSIKSTAGMLQMKADMAGSATVFGIIKSAALLKLPVELIGIVPAVENVISGDAYKPGDIISSSSGKTIEVKDTDAEGRIILADALEYASKLKPDQIIDFATLTGAVAVALGLFTAGVFTKNDKMSKSIIDASDETYEHAWRMPFWDEFNKLLESKIADVSNLGPRWGGAITAGKFLENFVDKNIPWMHIDLAGPALEHDLTNYTKDYCTGYGVRLITKYLEKL